MNKNIMVAVEKIEGIIEDLGIEYTFKNYLGEDVSYGEYKGFIPQERALNDRNKMLDILHEFFKHEKLNDFITLFAIYCNHYIRYNLHVVLQEDDFAIAELWNDVQDLNIRNYLLLIQKGIFFKNMDCFKKAIRIFPEYSLPYLYLFLDETKKAFEENNTNSELGMEKYYIKMNKEFKEYALGKGNFIKKSCNPALDVNPLPYINFQNKSCLFTISNGEQKLTKEDLQIDRLAYLEIPTYVCVDGQRNTEDLFIKKMELRDVNEQLEKSKMELEKAIESKNALIDHHAHNWKHIVYPKTVKEVAEALYAEGNIEYANRLFKAYNSENILQHDLQLLKLSHASSQTEMQEAFRNDILLSNARSGVGIKRIIEDSLDTVLFRIIMEDVDESYSLEQVKGSISGFNSIEQLRKSYTESFITQKKQNKSLMEWFNNNIYQFNLEINPFWEDVKIKANSVAYTQLVEICINLIHNAINYGVKSKEGFLNLKLEFEQVNDINYYTLTTENPVDYNSAFSEGSNQGLKSIRDTLEKLNGTDLQEDRSRLSVETQSEENISYRVKLYFKENLIVKRRKK